MTGYIFSRLLQAIPVLLAVAFIAFAMFYFVGDPVLTMLGPGATVQQHEALTRELGLDQNFVIQFGKFLLHASRGDFGLSYRSSRPVIDIIAERAPASLELAFSATVLSLLIGIPIGVFTALCRDSWLAKLFLILELLGASIPTFVIGILFIMVFAVWLGWLPSSGRGTVLQLGEWRTGFLTLSGLRSLVLPASTLAIFQITLIAQLVQSEMLDVMLTDYIKFARARGLHARTIYFGHALKNTLVPVMTAIGLQFGTAIAFAIVTETVFQWPGIGFLFMQSVGASDIPVMSAYLVLIALLFLVINLLVDLLYYVVDPRLRVAFRR